MKLNRNGYVNRAAVVLVFVGLLLVISLIFGIWAFSGRQNYKNNADRIASTDVVNAEAAQRKIDLANFNAEQTSSLTTYNGPSDYGSIVLQYPKVWSAYINAQTNSSGNSNAPIDAYFMPSYLSSVTDDGSANFALRVQVESQSYSEILQQFDQTQGITVTPFALPKVPNDVGVKVTGSIQQNVSGTMIILPLRSQALEVWTEGSNYLSDFNSLILANLSFSP